jgi:hypothetical protein
MAEVTFNRETGVAPEGITRFGQFRTLDGNNVTIGNYRSFAGDGGLGLADVFSLTFGTSGTATITLDAEAFAVSKVEVYKADGTVAGTANAPKITRRSNSSFTYSVSNGETATLYVFRTGRSETEYRVTVTAA